MKKLISTIAALFLAASLFAENELVISANVKKGTMFKDRIFVTNMTSKPVCMEVYGQISEGSDEIFLGKMIAVPNPTKEGHQNLVSEYEGKYKTFTIYKFKTEGEVKAFEAVFKNNDMDVIITGYQIEKASVNADYSKSQKTLTITRTLDSNKDNCENAFAYLSSQKQLIKGLNRVSEKSIQGSSSSSHYDASVKFNLLFSDSKLTATFTGINNIEEGVTWATKIAQDIFDYIDSVD